MIKLLDKVLPQGSKAVIKKGESSYMRVKG